MEGLAGGGRGVGGLLQTHRCCPPSGRSALHSLRGPSHSSWPLPHHSRLFSCLLPLPVTFPRHLQRAPVVLACTGPSWWLAASCPSFFLAQVRKPRPPVSSLCIICPWCIQLRQVQSGWYGTWVGMMGTAVGVPCCGAARGLGSSPAPSLVPA